MEDQESEVNMPVLDMFSVHTLESSEDPPMEEWSSLEILMEEENKKKALYREGLYDPGDGELCADYITMSASSVLRHPYYNYPAVIDPGIKEALLKAPDVLIYPNDGQALYLATCKEMNQMVVRSFYRGLLESHIDLRYYCIEPNGFRAMAKALQYNTTVQSLNLTDNFLNDDACYHVGDMLLTNKTITEINLRGCRIGPHGAKVLFCNLPQNKTLKVLDLSYNKLGDEGIEYLARAVLFGLNVQVLNLSYNNITGKGVACLVEPFETHNNFTHLDLSWNKLFTLGGPAFLMKLAESTCLQVLDLSWNYLGERSSVPLKHILLCPLLNKLNISNNKLEGEAVSNIIGGILSAKKLQTLDLSFNPMSPSDALKVLHKVAFRSAKVKTVLMDNVGVNEAFISLLADIKQKKDVVVTYGDVFYTFKGKGPDRREVVLNRIEYLTSSSRKNKGDIALIALTLQKGNRTKVMSEELETICSEGGLFLGEDLVGELCRSFPAPSPNPKIKVLDVNVLVEYIKRKWPNRKLPPTPPEPEQEPEQIIEKVEKKGKKGKKGK